MPRYRKALACASALLFLSPARAEDLRPLATRDARVDPAWEVGIDAGGAENEAIPFSTRVPSTRDVAYLPGVHFTVPMGSRAVLRGEWDLLRVSQVDVPTRRAGAVTTAGDPRAEAQGTFWASASGRSHLAGLVGVKVPSANDDVGAGTDRIDLDVGLAGSTDLFSARTSAGPIRFHANAGLRIRDAPFYTTLVGQDDLLHYGAAVTVPTRRALLMIEIAGDAGSRRDNDYTTVRGGARVPFRGGWTLYGAVGGGLTSESADVEGRAGISRAF